MKAYLLLVICSAAARLVLLVLRNHTEQTIHLQKAKHHAPSAPACTHIHIFCMRSARERNLDRRGTKKEKELTFKVSRKKSSVSTIPVVGLNCSCEQRQKI
jgi:hypothetical protein